MEFHISRAVREKLNIDELLFSYTGNVIFGNVAASRKLASQLNQARGAGRRSGEDDQRRRSLRHGPHRRAQPRARRPLSQGDRPRRSLSEAIRWFAAKIEPANLERLLLTFVEQFPNVAVYRGELTASEWLNGTTEGLPNREAALEELMLLWLANMNPAFAALSRIVRRQGPAGAERSTRNVTAALPDYLGTRPPVAPEVGSLFDALRAPMLASPDSSPASSTSSARNGRSISARTCAGSCSPSTSCAKKTSPSGCASIRPAPTGTATARPPGEPGLRRRRVRRLRRGFRRTGGAATPPTTRRRCTSTKPSAPTRPGCPTSSSIAKSTYVWLEQLSKKYGRHIHRLDQIPDEELRLLADRGITGLWLIGLWERSIASRTIKRLRGHGDAVASAYSLKEYTSPKTSAARRIRNICADRASRFGLRLASDMVPNHMGIDSDVGHRASRLVHLALGEPIPGLQLQRP